MYSASFVRIFLDTNVLVSAFAARGLCAEVLELVLLDHDLITGRNVLRELERALREKIKLSAARSTEIIDFVSSEATQVVDKADAAQLDIDAADALVVGEALAGQAELFVTGDAACLGLQRPNLSSYFRRDNSGKRCELECGNAKEWGIPSVAQHRPNFTNNIYVAKLGGVRLRQRPAALLNRLPTLKSIRSSHSWSHPV